MLAGNGLSQCHHDPLQPFRLFDPGHVPEFGKARDLPRKSRIDDQRDAAAREFNSGADCWAVSKEEVEDCRIWRFSRERRKRLCAVGCRRLYDEPASWREAASSIAMSDWSSMMRTRTLGEPSNGIW